MGVLVVLLVIGFAFGGLGWYVAAQKGRPELEGLILGFLFGPIGCLIAALLPTPTPEPAEPRLTARRPRPSWGDPEDPEAEAMDEIALGFLNEITPSKAVRETGA